MHLNNLLVYNNMRQYLFKCQIKKEIATNSISEVERKTPLTYHINEEIRLSIRVTSSHANGCLEKKNAHAFMIHIWGYQHQKQILGFVGNFVLYFCFCCVLSFTNQLITIMVFFTYFIICKRIHYFLSNKIKTIYEYK